MNILLITLDQFRGECLSCAGHPIVKTPNLDRLAREGVRLGRHYSQAAPCAPGRACLYTGLYQSNNRVVGNGTPLDARFDNVALAGRRAGYRPALFGYTDQGMDPRDAEGPTDPLLWDYEGILPGFDDGCSMAARDAHKWIGWLREKGYEVGDTYEEALKTEPERPAELSATAFLTERLIEWLDRQDGPWFAHLSHLRPHPPYTAAGDYARLYDPEAMPLPIAPVEERHPLHERLMTTRGTRSSKRPERMREVKAQYYGMITEVDFQLGRLWAALEARGAWDDTVIVVTSDHGEQMGDHGLVQKAGYFEQSYYILGIVRDPRRTAAHGRVVQAFTENIDFFPTLCDAMGVPIPAQCDGAALTPWLRGETPAEWRNAAHWEFDARPSLIREGVTDDRLETQGLAVLRTDQAAYVHFGDGDWLAFDLAADPTWRTPLSDPHEVLKLAQAMLTWRAQHLERTMTGMLLEEGGIGRWPPARALAGV